MVIIIGPPGAGKSVQASMLEEHGVAKWLSTSKLLREQQTDEEKEMRNKGELIDLSVTGRILREAMLAIDDSQFVVVDGFPRTDEQVEWLFSDDNPRELDGVLYIDLEEEEAVARLRLRREKDHRADDAEEVIKRRYEIFHNQNQPILDHFTRRGIKIEKVNGHGSIEEVYERVHKALHTLSGHR